MIMERHESVDPSPVTCLMNGLWGIREPVTFAAFCRWFSRHPSNVKSYPVIAAVLQHEKTLPCIKFIGDILAWQSFLFAVLPSTTTREQVSAIWKSTLRSLIALNRPAPGPTSRLFGTLPLRVDRKKACACFEPFVLPSIVLFISLASCMSVIRIPFSLMTAAWTYPAESKGGRTCAWATTPPSTSPSRQLFTEKLRQLACAPFAC